METIKDKIKKVYELAERGIDGERETAMRMLEKMLADNGLTLDDIIDNIAKTYEFRYTQKEQEIMFLQVCANYFGTKSEQFESIKSFITRNGTTGRKQRTEIIEITCSEYEYADITAMYAHYWMEFAKYKKEIEKDLLTAFIHREDLYNSTPDKNAGSNGDIDYSRLIALMRVGKKSEFRRRLACDL